MAISAAPLRAELLPPTPHTAPAHAMAPPLARHVALRAPEPRLPQRNGPIRAKGAGLRGKGRDLPPAASEPGVRTLWSLTMAARV